MCMRMGDTPDPDKMPIGFSDLDSSTQTALVIYDKLPDTFTGGQISTYSGKNLTALSFLLDLHLVEDHQTRVEVTDTILHVDRINIKKSVDTAKKELSKK
jgi:hypothetical protein